MKIVNLTAEEVLNILNSDEVVENKWGDNYRKYYPHGEEDVIGLYYKVLLDCEDEDSLNWKIKTRKKSEDLKYPWENDKIGRLWALIDRLEGTKSECINGIVLYNNYPIGVLFPRKLLKYKSGSKLLGKDSELDRSKKTEILKKVEGLIYENMGRGVYTEDFWLGNILINPEDYDDVRLFGLDEFGSGTRVETENYVETMKKASRREKNPWGYDLPEHVKRRTRNAIDEILCDYR